MAKYTKALATIVLASCSLFTCVLAYSECSEITSIASDSVSISVDAADDSETANKLASLLGSGISQLLHSQLVVVSQQESDDDESGHEVNLAAFTLEGEVVTTNTRARVTFRLLDTACSDIIWMGSYDPEISGDILAVSDGVANSVAGEVVKVASNRID